MRSVKKPLIIKSAEGKSRVDSSRLATESVERVASSAECLRRSPTATTQLAVWFYEQEYPSKVRPHGGNDAALIARVALDEFGSMASDLLAAVAEDPSIVGMERIGWHGGQRAPDPTKPDDIEFAVYPDIGPPPRHGDRPLFAAPSLVEPSEPQP